MIARADLAQKQARLAQVRSISHSHSGIDASSDVLQSQLIQRLREQESLKSRELSEAMKTYAASFNPAIVARDQLKEAVAALSTHDNQRVTKALNDGLQAVLTGTKPAKAAMDEAQAEATRILKPYQK